MSKTQRFTFLLSFIAVAGLIFVLAGCEKEVEATCCGVPGAEGCCTTAEHTHGQVTGKEAKCCGNPDAEGCCASDGHTHDNEADKEAKCCGDDPSKCCGSKQ